MAAKKQRKIIDLPTTVIKALGELAKEDNRLVKNYMEQVLIDHATPVDKKTNK